MNKCQMHIECNYASYGVTPHEMVLTFAGISAYTRFVYFNTPIFRHKHLPLIFHAINFKNL